MTLKRSLTRWLVLNRIGKAPSTRHWYWELVKSIRRAWRDCLDQPVDQIGAADVDRFAIAVGHFSPSRWNGIVTIVRATVPAARSLKRRPVKPTRPPPPSQAEFSALLAACDSLERSKAGLVIEFLAHTGLRITAARRLRWSDVLEDRIQYVAKGGRLCSVPLINGLADVVRRLAGLEDGSGLLLPRGSIRRGLAKACAKAGLRNLSHHDFRHLFATRCIESGVDVPTVARWLGHADGGALLSRRYFHLLDGHSRAMAARVSLRGQSGV